MIYLTIRDEVGFGGTGVQNARAVRCINDIATEPPPKVLGTCTQAIEDSVGLFGGTYYICKSNSWVNATEIEYAGCCSPSDNRETDPYPAHCRSFRHFQRVIRRRNISDEK